MTFNKLFRSHWHTVVFLALILVFDPVRAQEAAKFTISGGGGAKQGSVYSAVVGDLAGVCSTDQLTLAEVNSSGGPENLARLLGNKVNAAVVPAGLLFNAQQENASSVANIKTLAVLYPEALYLIARSDTKKEGGVTLLGKNIGGNSVTFNNPEDLKGRRVGAVGGSMVDGQTFSDMMRYGWVMTSYEKTTDMLGALTTGEIDAVLIQASVKDSPAVAAIKGNFKLIALRGNSDTMKVWTATKVQYANLNNNRAVDTVAAPALLVTRKWSSADMNAKMLTLRDCFRANVGNLKDKTGTHPAWQMIDENEQGPWPHYEFPRAAAQAQAPAKKK